MGWTLRIGRRAVGAVGPGWCKVVVFVSASGEPLLLDPAADLIEDLGAECGPRGTGRGRAPSDRASLSALA